MTEKNSSAVIQENNKSSKQDLISHQLLFDKKNIDQLEEILKTMVTKNQSAEADDTLEDNEEQEINLEISPSDEEDES